MLLSRPTRVIALIGILSFHIGIGVMMGLPWFSLTMIAIDSIFIRDRIWSAMQTRIIDLARLARAEGPPRSDTDPANDESSVADPKVAAPIR